MYCQNFSRFNSFENAKKLFLLLLCGVVESELNFKHSNYFIYHYGNSIITVIFADGRILSARKASRLAQFVKIVWYKKGHIMPEPNIATVRTIL